MAEAPGDRSGPPVGRLLLIAVLAMVSFGWVSLAAGRLQPAPDPHRLPPPAQIAGTSRTVTVPVLIYHSFRSGPIDEAQADYQISTALFDAQLRILRVRGWKSITAAEVAAALAVGGQPRAHSFVITVDDGLRDGLTEALPILRRHGFVATFFVIAGRVGTPDYLTWDELRQLQASGMEIGSHSFSHPQMGEIPADQDAAEVRDAQAAISRGLGEAPLTFAYPGGSYNDAAVAALRDNGLLAGFTTERGNTFSWSSRLTIPRLNVSGDWPPQLLLRYVRSGS